MSFKILAFGAGAIGTYIGGSLVISGHRVTFLERPEVAASLSQRGLRLTIGDREHRIEAPHLASSIEDALQQGPFDAAIFALKSFDTEAMIETLLPYRADLPPIVCLQNGVENELLLAGALGEDKVIAATVTSAIGRQAAGDIVLERLRGMGLAAGHPISTQLAQACTQAGLNARLYPSATEMKWSKMLTNLLANACSAILNMKPGEIFNHAGLYRLEIEQLREALRVMRRQQIEVVDLPGTPVRLLAFAVQRLPAGLSRPLLRNAVQGGRGEKMPSFYIDMKSGRGQTEVDWLNGAVVRYGKKLGIPTPVNQLLNETLQAIASGALPPDSFANDPEKLLQNWRKGRLSG